MHDLLVLVAALVHLAAAPVADSTGTLEGIVRERDRPVPYANVIVIGTRRGTQTDLNGRYRIVGVSVGQQEVRVTLPGLVEQIRSVEIRDGRTTRLEVVMPSSRGPDVGDIGPAFPETRVRNRLRWCPELDVYRIRSTLRDDRDSSLWAMPRWSNTHVQVAHARPRSDDWRSRLRRLLDSPDSFRAYPPGVMKACAGGFDPGVVLRFTDHRGVSDVLLCFKCEELKVITDGISGPIVDFGPNARRFLDLALEVFPEDREFLALRTTREAVSR